MLKITGTINGEVHSITIQEAVRIRPVEKRKTVELTGWKGRVVFVKKFPRQKILSVRVKIDSSAQEEFERLLDADSVNCSAGLTFAFDTSDFLPEETIRGYMKFIDIEYFPGFVYYTVEVMEK